MTYRLVIQPRAARDLREAAAHIAQDSPAAARRWLDSLAEAIETLSTHPLRCGLAPEDARFPVEIRQLLVGRRSGVYRVLFTIRQDVLHVLHLRHGRRLPAARGELGVD